MQGATHPNLQCDRNSCLAGDEAAGWSQGELTRLLGVSPQTVNAVETDKFDPGPPLALRMAKLFGVAVTDLFIVHGEPAR